MVAWSAEIDSLVAAEGARAGGAEGLSDNVIQPESSDGLVLGDTWVNHY